MTAATDVDDRLDADIREALAATPFPAVTLENLVTFRAERYGAPIDPALLSDQVSRRSIQIPGPEGDPEITVRIHRPVAATGPLPCMFWMHGGGMVMGTEFQDDLRFDRWCVRHNIMAISVNYRLAPETPYPGAIEDCYAALVWVHQNADELGIDPHLIGVGGASAGAGLSAALTLVARDRGLPGPAIFSQLLIYPMLDHRQSTASSAWEVPIWPPSANTFGWAAYLGDLDRTNVPAYASPALADDLSDLPAAYVMVGALDGFVDEDIDYAMRLNRAGVDVELHLYPGAPHGFEGLLPGAAVSKQATADIHNWIKKTYAH
jgi:acetyl esterase/lipase